MRSVEIGMRDGGEPLKYKNLMSSSSNDRYYRFTVEITPPEETENYYVEYDTNYILWDDIAWVNEKSREDKGVK